MEGWRDGWVELSANCIRLQHGAAVHKPFYFSSNERLMTQTCTHSSCMWLYMNERGIREDQVCLAVFQ